MIIFNHPAFPARFRSPDALASAFGATPRHASTPSSARKRRFIKPNKTEPFARAAAQFFIGGIARIAVLLPKRICRESCQKATIKKGVFMTVLYALGVVVLAGLAVVGLVAIGFEKARKAIDAMKFDAERL